MVNTYAWLVYSFKASTPIELRYGLATLQETVVRNCETEDRVSQCSKHLAAHSTTLMRWMNSDGSDAKDTDLMFTNHCDSWPAFEVCYQSASVVSAKKSVLGGGSAIRLLSEEIGMLRKRSNQEFSRLVLARDGHLGLREERPMECHVAPNVRAKRATPAGRQARVSENVPRTADSGLVACRWRSA